MLATNSPRDSATPIRAESWVGVQRESPMFYTASKVYLVASITSLAFATVFMMIALASWSVEKTDGPEIRFELRQSLQR